MDDKIYLHAINEFRPLNFKKLEEIFKSGAILSRNMQEEENLFYKWTYGFNGYDYISVCCHKDKRDGDSYKEFVLKNISLLINPVNIDFIKPDYVDIDIATFRKKGSFERITNMNDECQVKDIIPLDDIYGICFPIDSYLLEYSDSYFLSEISDTEKYNYVNSLFEKVLFLSNKYNYNLPIYDTNSMLLIDKNLIKEKVIHKKNYREINTL